MEVKGIIIHLFSEQVVSEKFKKREFVLKTIEQYPQEVKFQCVNDKTSILNFAKVGDEVLVKFNLAGKSWTSKEGKKDWFNSLNAWKIEMEGNTATAPTTLKSIDPTDNMPF